MAKHVLTTSTLGSCCIRLGAMAFSSNSLSSMFRLQAPDPHAVIAPRCAGLNTHLHTSRPHHSLDPARAVPVKHRILCIATASTGIFAPDGLAASASKSSPIANLSIQDLEKWKVVDLKTALSQQRLPVGGLKADLIARLLAASNTVQQADVQQETSPHSSNTAADNSIPHNITSTSSSSSSSSSSSGEESSITAPPIKKRKAAVKSSLPIISTALDALPLETNIHADTSHPISEPPHLPTSSHSSIDNSSPESSELRSDDPEYEVWDRSESSGRPVYSGPRQVALPVWREETSPSISNDIPYTLRGSDPTGTSSDLLPQAGTHTHLSQGPEGQANNSENIRSADSNAIRSSYDEDDQVDDDSQDREEDKRKPRSKSEAVPLPFAAEEDYDVPPFPPYYRGRSYALKAKEFPTGNFQNLKDLLLANPNELLITALGSASHIASPRRSLASLALCRGKDIFLFDAGDDTQRHMGQQMHVRPGKVYRIFITSLTADCLLGLPGLLCTVCSSRLRGHENSDIPIHVYGPPGIAEYLSVMFKVSNTYLEVSIMVHEFSLKAVAEEDTIPGLYNRRAKIWREMMPPDQLNPKGFIDGDLTRTMPTQGRATVKRGIKSAGGVLAFDPRANFLAFPPPTAGDPERTGLTPSEATWTIFIDVAALVVCKALRSPHPTMGYVYTEADRVGQLSMERCEALKVVPGISFSQLKSGVSVVNADKEVVTASMVVSADRPGRVVAILGSCSDASHIADIAQGADLLIYSCGFPGTSQAAVTATAAAKAAAATASPQIADTATADDVGVVRSALWTESSAAGGGRGKGGDEREVVESSSTQTPDDVDVSAAVAGAQLAVAIGAKRLMLTKFDGRDLLSYSKESRGLEPNVGAQVQAARTVFLGPITCLDDFLNVTMEKNDGRDDPPPFDPQALPAEPAQAKMKPVRPPPRQNFARRR